MMSDNASQRCICSWQCVSLYVSVSDVLVSVMSENASHRCMYSWQCVCLCICLSVTYWCRWCQKMPVTDVCTADNVCVSCLSVSDVRVSMMSDNASQRCMCSWQCVCLCVCLSVTYWCRWCQEMPVSDVCTAGSVCVSVCVCQWRTGVGDVRKCHSEMYVQLTMCVSMCVCQWRTGVGDVRKCHSEMYVHLTMCVSVCLCQLLV